MLTPRLLAWRYRKAIALGFATRDAFQIAANPNMRDAEQPRNKSGQWTSTGGGWETRKRGTETTHRTLRSSSPKPNFQGSANKYGYVFEHEGNPGAYSKSEHGYMRQHNSVEEAKAHITGRK